MMTRFFRQMKVTVDLKFDIKKLSFKNMLTSFQYSFRFLASVEDRLSLAVGRSPVMRRQQIGRNVGGHPLHTSWRNSPKSVWSRLIKDENFSDLATWASVRGGRPVTDDFGTGPKKFQFINKWGSIRIFDIIAASSCVIWKLLPGETIIGVFGDCTFGLESVFEFKADGLGFSFGFGIVFLAELWFASPFSSADFLSDFLFSGESTFFASVS